MIRTAAFTAAVKGGGPDEEKRAPEVPPGEPVVWVFTGGSSNPPEGAAAALPACVFTPGSSAETEAVGRDS